MLPVGVLTRERASCARLSALALLWGRQSCLQAAFQAAVSVCGEFLGLRRFHAGGHEAGENTCELREWSVRVRRRPERPPAGTIACPTRRPTARHESPKPKGELRSPGQAEACPTKARRRQECRRCRHECPRHVQLYFPNARQNTSTTPSATLRGSCTVFFRKMYQ